MPVASLGNRHGVADKGQLERGPVRAAVSSSKPEADADGSCVRRNDAENQDSSWQSRSAWRAGGGGRCKAAARSGGKHESTMPQVVSLRASASTRIARPAEVDSRRRKVSLLATAEPNLNAEQEEAGLRSMDSSWMPEQDTSRDGGNGGTTASASSAHQASRAHLFGAPTRRRRGRTLLRGAAPATRQSCFRRCLESLPRVKAVWNFSPEPSDCVQLLGRLGWGARRLLALLGRERLSCWVLGIQLHRKPQHAVLIAHGTSRPPTRSIFPFAPVLDAAILNSSNPAAGENSDAGKTIKRDGAAAAGSTSCCSGGLVPVAASNL